MAGIRQNVTLAEYNALLRSDFNAFIERCFRLLNSDTPFLGNWHIEAMAAALDSCRRGEILRLIINVPPRSLKSISASVALPAWILGHSPAAQVLCVSYAQDLADKLARDCRTVMSSRFYQRLFRTRLSASKQSVQEFVTTAGGFRMATSVGGVLTGRGADFIIIDDPLKPVDALSETLRRATNEWFDNTLLSRLNDKRTGAIILIMQRLHEDDLVGHLLERAGWKLVSFPAIAEQYEEHVVETPFGRNLFVRRAGEALHPEREPLGVLANIKGNLGEYIFASQYQQAPAPLEGAIVKAHWFKNYNSDELPNPFDQIVQSWDTANKVTELSDYSVCTTWGIKGGRIYLVHVLRRRLNYPELKRTVCEQRQAYSATLVLIEDRASGTQLIQELRSEGLSCLRGYEPDHDKVMRLHAQSALIENGFVYLPEQACWRDEYLHELITFPNAKYDDQVDSTSQALAWFNSASREPAVFTFYAQQLANQRLAEGYALPAIAAMIGKQPDQMSQWVDGPKDLRKQSLADIYEEKCARLRGERNCGQCGKDLPKRGYFVLFADRRYCSDECASKASR
jgi:predicted phage terminase large subunit-like protein